MAGRAPDKAEGQPFTPVSETMRGRWMGHASTGASLGHEAPLAAVYCAITGAAAFRRRCWLFRHRTAA